jgi:hypothetical protein
MRSDDDFRPLLDLLDERPIHSDVFGDVIYRGRDREAAEDVVIVGDLLATPAEEA